MSVPEQMSGIFTSWVYYGRATRRKPLFRPGNIKRRRDWAVQMVERPMAFWSTVIFSEESRFAIFYDSGRRLCRELDPKGYRMRSDVLWVTVTAEDQRGVWNLNPHLGKCENITLSIT
ncbi:uncharacterized protein LOC143040479 [Oratosquilla oratoria]|uniref:uncharacterized protein LOC143040479 n=1 Tax=Oratosquilla oratoria TaxID=337810 RepID=UPI003F76B028